ncbi:MAG: serine/threonine protein kinase [Kiritimatiellae bacterium]|nr:serine/threonine protein kinase [Kiritimatiellia bacterium]
MSLGVDEIEGILSAHGRMPTGASFQDGETFGNWRLTAFIGKGGNGEVYRAVHVALGTSAAVKVLFRNEPRVRERFVREAKLLSELKSASFPQFLEYGEANGRAYLVMELLEPGDLPSGDREVARFLRQVCDAVAELHARGIVHRDIKPSNILWRTGTTGVSPVGDTGRTGVPPVGDTGTTGVPPVAVPVLADLGLAKDIAISDAGRPTSDITLGGVGTPGYGAPEQMERGEATVASDIHALGVLADRCFGGKPPRAWARIIERATSSIPERRYQSVDDLVKAIQGRNLSRRLWTGLAVLLLAGLSAIGVAMLYKRHGGEEQKSWSIGSREPIVSVEKDYVPYENPVSGRKGYRIVTKTNTVDGVVIRLNGETVSFAKPISLEPGEYRIIGPGRLDADISGPSNALVRIKGCVLNNLTAAGYRKNKVNYVLEGDAYLNFANLDDDYRIRKCIRHFDGLANGDGGDVAFRGPLTIEELRKVQSDRRKREWQKELDEANATQFNDSRTRIY